MHDEPPTVHVAVLGPLELSIGSRSVEVRGARQRALLAALVLHNGRTVRVETLIEDVFGAAPPADARNAIQTYMTRLRRILGPAAEAIGTTAGGYRLDVPASALDVAVFLDLLDRSRDAESAEAEALLDGALRLWRGRPFADSPGLGAQMEATRLDELYLGAREDLARLLLGSRRTAQAVGLLEALVLEHPWRQQSNALLVTALASEGRTPDALAAYARFRDGLREELGLDPPDELRRLEERILRGDASLRQRRIAVGERRRLPSPPGTRLIGRAELLTAVSATCATPGLVTLVGPGGVGKTRLALALLDEVGQGTTGASDAEPPEPAWVDLAVLHEDAAVAASTVDALALHTLPGETAEACLGSWAGEGIVVLDNCEHVRDGVRRLLDVLLRPGSRLRVLATSREPLAIPGERVLAVPPLPVPDVGTGDVGTGTSEQPAVALFLDRVGRSIAETIARDVEALQQVAAICRALDGLPLALELAAARVGPLSIGDLADRLDDRFGLLRSERSDVVPRHQTLAAVADWSFDLLSLEERTLFPRLSVFAGVFDLPAAEAVAADAQLRADRVADLLARLVRRSLLAQPDALPLGRYRLLQPLRAYADSRLPEADREPLRRRHAAFVIDTARRGSAAMRTRDEAAGVELLQTWLDDVRAAWRAARDTDDARTAADLVVACFRLSYWQMRTDILGWAHWVLAAAPQHPELGAVHAAAATQAWAAGRLPEAIRLATAGIAAAGGPQAAGSLLPLEALGDAAMLAGDLGRALAAYEQQLELVTATGDLVGHAIALANLSLCHTYARDDRAEHAAREALALAEKSGNPTAIAMSDFALGEALAQTDPQAAARALDEARETAGAVGNRFIDGIALTATVALRGRHGPPHEAYGLYREAVEHWRRAANPALLATAMRNLVHLLVRTGHDEAAVSLAATVALHAPAPSYGAEAERSRQALEAVRLRLGAQAYAAADHRGRRRSLEDAAEEMVDLLGRLAGGRVEPTDGRMLPDPAPWGR